jgi:hypothetical protein
MRGDWMSGASAESNVERAGVGVRAGARATDRLGAELVRARGVIVTLYLTGAYT